MVEGFSPEFDYSVAKTSKAEKLKTAGQQHCCIVQMSLVGLQH